MSLFIPFPSGREGAGGWGALGYPGPGPELASGAVSSRGPLGEPQARATSPARLPVPRRTDIFIAI